MTRQRLPRRRSDADLREVLMERVEPATDGSGCLRWLGYHTPNGYGRIAIKRKQRQAHVVSHELWIGPVPDGMQVDHVAARGCRHRDCINPAHLEAVTPAENARRVARATHCSKGHEFTPENTRMKLRPTKSEHYWCRTCRECIRLDNAARKARKREARRAA